MIWYYEIYLNRKPLIIFLCAFICTFLTKQLIDFAFRLMFFCFLFRSGLHRSLVTVFFSVNMCWDASFACLCSWDMVLSVVVHCLNKNRWNDIQSSDIKHQRPVELWCIDRLQEQRERWLRGWKSWKKEIDDADRRQAAWGLLQILFGVWGSGVYVSQDLVEKLLPWGKEWRSEWERCKGMCGALRVWMIGEINQVPSWPSCQSIAFLSAPLQCNHAYCYVFFLFFLKNGTQCQVLLLSMHGWWVSVGPCLFL